MPTESNLDRFVAAQDDGEVFQQAISELQAGRKRSHWMWFVFPQLLGLGHSEMSRRFALANVDEARAYLNHEVLGPRIRQCAALLLESQSSSAVQIFGDIDAKKLRSSMTLFAAAAGAEMLFADVLDRFFDGSDPLTIELLHPGPPQA